MLFRSATVAEAGAKGGFSSARALVSTSSAGVGSAEAQVSVARAALARAEADAHRAALDLERTKQLVEAKAVAQKTYDDVVSANEAAQAALQGAKAQLAAAEEGRHVAQSRVAELNLRQAERYLPDNIYTALENFEKTDWSSKLLGADVKARFADLKRASADRCSRALGTFVKAPEVQYHHEVYNQFLWNLF